MSMSTAPSFDFAPLLPAGLPAPAARWTGLAKYSFVGGNNDPDQVPVDGLIEAVDTVLIEQETYQGSLNRLTRLGVKAVGIPLDDEGMRMDALALALVDHKRRGITPKYIYTIPTVQNPTGSILPESRRAGMLKLSREYGVPI